MTIMGVMNRVEAVSVDDAKVSGDRATVTVSLQTRENDGTFGESCRNIAGCYTKVTKKCDVILTWSSGWKATSERLICK